MRLDVSLRKKLGPFSLAADFSVDAERVGVFGESGSGKSTLVNLLAGILAPDDGSVHLDGECLYSRARRINVPPERRRIAMVFQHPYLFPHLDVRGNLLYGFKRCAPELRKVDFDVLVEVLKLEGALGRGVNNLSGGEKQRVAIGRAVLSNPRLLIMDEPLSALDEGLKHQIIPYLKDVCARFGIPFLFISHSLIEMRLMAGEVVVMEGGKAIEQTTPDQLAREKMGKSPVGYINLLRLANPRVRDGLTGYPWGSGELLVSAGVARQEALFELSSKDIILFKKHPEAISARNLLCCRVAGTFAAGNKTGVDLECGGERLVAEVVRQAADELDIRVGTEIFAAIKASAFRVLG